MFCNTYLFGEKEVLNDFRDLRDLLTNCLTHMLTVEFRRNHDIHLFGEHTKDDLKDFLRTTK